MDFIHHSYSRLIDKAHLEKLKEQIAATVKKAGMEAELELITDENLRREPPPETEWWDEALVQGSYDIPISYDIQAPDGEALITNLVQHPVPILPPDAGKVAPMQVMLTKKERKKLRRQRRLEALKERQDKIRLGLMPPDAPKVKIANLMRVLGTEAVQDPTQVEAQVRKQMADRQQQHESHNAAAQLTKEQKKEKKAQKLTEDISESAHVAVFRYVCIFLSRFQQRNSICARPIATF